MWYCTVVSLRINRSHAFTYDCQMCLGFFIRNFFLSWVGYKRAYIHFDLFGACTLLHCHSSSIMVPCKAIIVTSLSYIKEFIYLPVRKIYQKVNIELLRIYLKMTQSSWKGHKHRHKMFLVHNGHACSFLSEDNQLFQCWTLFKTLTNSVSPKLLQKQFFRNFIFRNIPLEWRAKIFNITNPCLQTWSFLFYCEESSVMYAWRTGEKGFNSNFIWLPHVTAFVFWKSSRHVRC